MEIHIKFQTAIKNIIVQMINDYYRREYLFKKAFIDNCSIMPLII